MEGRPQGVTGPVGEPGLPPARFGRSGTMNSTSTTSGRASTVHTRSHPPSSRAGRTDTPPTTSRTHVPSVQAQGFYRPMSSQRLQAQRGPRAQYQPPSGPNAGNDNMRSVAINNRMSMGSATQPAGSVYLSSHQEEDIRPMSRETDATDPKTANVSPNGADTIRSRGESDAPLQEEISPSRRPRRLDLENVHRLSASIQPPRSPRSFRSSFLLPRRESRQSRISDNIRGPGHEKLASAESSPKIPPNDYATQITKTELGKNYEYFSGNTFFCWGGRLQNTREKPISLATLVLVIVPLPLYLAQP